MADESGKKRKRVVNGSSTPNKKSTAHLAAAGNINVSHINGKGLYPIVVASNTINPPNFSFDAFAKPINASAARELPSPLTHSILLHSAKHPRLDYTAATSSDDGLAHYVAAYSSRTNTLQIVPVYHARLQAVLRTEPQKADATPRKTIAQQRLALGQEFGTKKAKKIIESRALNAVTSKIPGGKEEEVQNAILANIAENAPEQLTEAEKTKAMLADKPIPQPNLSAETVEAIYPLQTLIPPALMKHIPVKDWQEEAKDKENGVQGHNRYPMYRVIDVIRNGNMDKLKALRYTALLLQFHDALVNAGKTGKKVPKKTVLHSRLSEYPEALVDSVQKTFSNEKFELNKFHLERLHTHICALSLYIDDYTTDISHLRDDLKVEPRTIANYFQQLGCKIRSLSETERLARKNLTKAFAATVKIAVLKCPPEFPKIKYMRRK